MDTLPDLNALQVFSAVVDAQGFRGAARVLGIPKSTVSRKLADLEAQLGLRLLQRTTRKIALTDAGETLYRQCAPALASLVDAQKSLIEETQAAPRGQLRLTAPGTFAELFLRPVLEDFYQRFPEVRVTVDLSDRFVDLVGEGFDLAIRAGELPDSTLVARALGNSESHISGRFRFCASPAYLKSHGVPRHPRELGAHECLFYGNSDRGAKWAFLARRRRLLINLRPRVCCASFFLLRDAALAGRGITRLPSFFVTEALESGQLVEVLAEYAPPGAPLHAVYPSSRNVPPRVRAFLDVLTEHFAVGSWDGRMSGEIDKVRR